MVNVFVISAHPDDEVIGLGGTMVKHISKGDKVFLSVITDGSSVNYNKLKGQKIIKKRKKECLAASKILGISEVKFHELPDAKLDSIPQLELNKIIEEEVRRIKPRIVYTHDKNDIHSDHKLIHLATMVATRRKVKEVYSYEVISSTTNFKPNLYINISKELSKKLRAINCYKSILKNFPDSFSMKAIEGLASVRGMESGLKFAEAFFCIKKIVS